MIPFNNLKPLAAMLAAELHEAMQRVAASGWYVLGPEVVAFEAELAAYLGRPHAVAVANGTDAIELALRAGEVGAGDEVVTVSHTAMATVRAVERTGARPVLVDVDPETLTMSAAAATAAVGARTKAIVPVHLYGHPAELAPLCELAERHRLLLLEDCAQAHGALYQGRKVGGFGQMAAFSFYPTKNLGAFGDGGAVVTGDAALAARLRRLRNYGETTKFVFAERGINSRLDEIQAAVLRVKLVHLDAHNDRRREIARIYSGAPVRTPTERADARHVYHLYVVRGPLRDRLREELRRRGVDSAIHYPVPVHLQASHADLGFREGSLPVTEGAVREILSLPLYVGMSDGDARTVVAAVGDSLEALGG
jgi:dTDP-4-amino-4,6-dideoxygalactose transaminase